MICEDDAQRENEERIKTYEQNRDIRKKLNKE
jgi:hypothetical protein